MRISDWSSDVCSSDLAAVVLLLLGVEAQILEQRHTAVRQDADRFPGVGTDTVLTERDRAAEYLRQGLGDRVLGHGRVAPALGAAEMREDQELGRSPRHLTNRRGVTTVQGRVVTLTGGHRAVVERERTDPP